MFLRYGLLALAALLLPVSAHADSDSYYCVGAGYLAVEFRAFNTPGLSAPHVLRIARFDEQGPRWAGEVTLEDFQTHTLACGAAAVLIEGAGARERGFVSCLVALDADTPRIAWQTATPFQRVGALPPGPPSFFFGSQEGIQELPQRGGHPRFRLHVTRSIDRSGGATYHHIRATLEQVDSSERVVRELVIAEGTVTESVDLPVAPGP
ncbi:MAG TPA: hypothetical protein VF198_14350 [Vicinamibacterales bacterium]